MSAASPPTHPTPPPVPPWTPDPGRWERGDWDFNPGDGPDDWQNDATKDAPWEDPSILRRRIGTEAELEAVADAIVRGKEITEAEHTPEGEPTGETRVLVGKVGNPNRLWVPQSYGLGQHVVIENLKALIEEVQAHQDVKLCKVETEEDAEGFLRVTRRWVEDADGNKLPDDTQLTELRLWHCVVASSNKKIKQNQTAKERHFCDMARDAKEQYENENYQGYEIGISLFVEARIIDDVDNAFWRASINTEADFQNSHFMRSALFDGTRFNDNAKFDSARFAGVAMFQWARFTGKADFYLANFEGDASFDRAHFAGDVRFEVARFAGDADFDNARFAGDALFQDARFARHAKFGYARFDGKADFHLANFEGEASFHEVRFARKARFGQSRFAGFARFSWARFAEDAWFSEAHFATQAMFSESHFTGKAEFSSVHFDGLTQFVSCTFEHDADFLSVTLNASVFFTEATLDERLTFVKTHFSQHARLGFNHFLARGGATIELSPDQLRLTRPDSTILKRAWQWICDYFRFDASHTIIEGGDSKDPDALDCAARDYELLAANFAANQPATDEVEDACRWMAKELHRRTVWIRSWQKINAKINAPIPLTPGPAPRHVPDWVWDPIDLLGRAFGSMSWLGMLVWWPIEHVVIRWLVVRTAVGYLLDWKRPLITGGAVILLCTMLYWCIHTDSTYIENSSRSFWDSLYFSIVTFTSLGYGDMQPKGWFKGLAATEALTGLTLMALFTVSWARKMVR